MERMRGPAMTWLEFAREVGARWSVTKPAPRLTRIEYLREIARLAPRRPLAPEGRIGEALDAFRRIVMARPNDIRNRLLGSNVQLLKELPGYQRRALRALEVWPDLLSPIGELRYEPSHSRLLAYFMGGGRVPELAGDLLREFLELAGCTADFTDPVELVGATVTPEAFVRTGRVDIRIETKRLVTFVEVKVDAGEGPDQLPRYRKALDAHGTGRERLLVYLTLPGAAPPPRNVECVHVDFAQLLRAWLPHATTDCEQGGLLSRYLKSVALVLGVAGAESYERWTSTEQRSALEIVMSL